MITRLTPPKVVTFWIAVVIALLGFVGAIAKVPVLTNYAFWFEFVAFVLLALALLVKGL